MSTTVVVLSDIHANATALRSALAASHRFAPDKIVVLGDLLTYGVDVEETLETIRTLASNGASLLLGNHDKLYIDLDRDELGYIETLPDWIRESAEHTRRLLAGVDLSREFSFEDEIEIEGFYFSHANPFGVPDWTYLNTTSEIARAADTLVRRGYRRAVFGHTHRRRVHEVVGNVVARLPDQCVVPLDAASTTIVNAGSVGQPRGEGACLLYLTLADAKAEISLHMLSYDVGAHLASIERSDLSEATRSRLARFFAAS